RAVREGPIELLLAQGQADLRDQLSLVLPDDRPGLQADAQAQALGRSRQARLASPVARASRACPARLRAVHCVLRAARLRLSASARTGWASSDLPCRTWRMPCCTQTPAASHPIPVSSARPRDLLRWRRAWS